jgi:hypothetical protein
MLRTFACAVVALFVLSVGLVMAADKEAKGTIKKVDAATNTITVTVDGKDMDFMVGNDAKILDATGGDLKDRLKSADLKAGAKVTVTCTTKDGKDVCTKVQLSKS